MASQRATSAGRAGTNQLQTKSTKASTDPAAEAKRRLSSSVGVACLRASAMSAMPSSQVAETTPANSPCNHGGAAVIITASSAINRQLQDHSADPGQDAKSQP